MNKNPFTVKWTPRELELLAEIGPLTDEPGQAAIDAATKDLLTGNQTYDEVMAIIAGARRQTGEKK